MTGMNPMLALKAGWNNSLSLLGYEVDPWVRLQARLKEALNLSDDDEIDYILREIDRLHREQRLPSRLQDVPENDHHLLRFVHYCSIVAKPSREFPQSRTSLRVACYKGSHDHVIFHKSVLNRIVATLPSEPYDVRENVYLIEPVRAYGFLVLNGQIEPRRRRILTPSRSQHVLKDPQPFFWRMVPLALPTEQTPAAPLVRLRA